MKFYYVDAQNQPAGPYTADEMAALKARGEITDRTLVAREGDADWKAWPHFAASFSVPAVAEAVAAQPAAPAAPAAPPMPVSVRVFGILNLVFGSCGLLAIPFSLISIFSAAHTPLIALGGPVYHGWAVFSTVLGAFGTALMIASGIGLCLYREWARKLAVGYAWFSIVFGAIGILVHAVTLVPHMQEGDFALLGGVIGGLVGGVIGLIYPVLLIVFLRKAAVRDALLAGQAARAGQA